ncbi:MAG: VOC family protein [Methanobacteriaceae archaeon]|nr:VOC family protein [Methanobacteriaceae archaeon]
MQIKLNTMIVQNMEESIKFYTKHLGFKIHSTYNLPNNNKITLLQDKGEVMIELIENTDYETGFYSIGIEVENIEKEITKLKEKGIKILQETTKITVGEMAKIQDPNGVILVLIHHNLK